MNAPQSTVRAQVSEQEWLLRVDLAAAYRLIALHGWDDLVFTHVSARIPGPEHHFLINPYGLMFDEITASSLVKVDMDCRPLLPTPYPVNPAGFVIHSAIHAVREDAGCVMHTHTRAGVAVSAQKRGRRRWCWGRSPTTTTRASRCSTTRSRACRPTSARATT
jgi:ribulose-5-phosphate 4-epimerase/fuculose-1-phosphate aldolase